MADIFSSPVQRTIKRQLDNSSAQHRVIVNNIANLDTPGFKASRLKFDDLLNEASAKQQLPLAQTNARHLPPLTGSANGGQVTTVKELNMDTEMAELAKTDIEYNTYIEFLKRDHTILKTAITGGR